VAPGERLRVWLKLDMDDDDQPADLFQVTCARRTCRAKPIRSCMSRHHEVGSGSAHSDVAIAEAT
jgi:hypothetical protein